MKFIPLEIGRGQCAAEPYLVNVSNVDCFVHSIVVSAISNGIHDRDPRSLSASRRRSLEFENCDGTLRRVSRASVEE